MVWVSHDRSVARRAAEGRFSREYDLPIQRTASTFGSLIPLFDMSVKKVLHQCVAGGVAELGTAVPDTQDNSSCVFTDQLPTRECQHFQFVLVQDSIEDGHTIDEELSPVIDWFVSQPQGPAECERRALP